MESVGILEGDYKPKTWRPAGCHYHIRVCSHTTSIVAIIPATIKAPEGKHVELEVTQVSGECEEDCTMGGTDVKFDDMRRVGARYTDVTLCERYLTGMYFRMCCLSHLKDVGKVVTTKNLAIISVFSSSGKQTFSLKYRTGKLA